MKWPIARSIAAGWLAAALAACSSQPPTPSWALEGQSASERAVKAYLQGHTRVADLAWNTAFHAVAATGQAQPMARMALLECAAQTAALALTDCPRYASYAAGAAPAEQAYARYLQARHTAQDVALLPQAQQAVAAQLLVGGAQIHSLPAGEALSQLTAAGVALRAGAIGPAAVQQAVQAASEQGWRRAAMAWVLVAQRLAQEAGDTAGAQAQALRLQILQEDARSRSKEK